MRLTQPLIVLFCSFWMFCVSPLWSQGPNSFPPSGNVGIGTSSPLTSLHIEGDVRGGGTYGQLNILTDFGSLTLGSKHPSYAHLITDRSRFFFNTDVVIGGGSVLSSYQSSPLYFATNNGADVAVTINSNGKVGMGVSNPATRLHVSGSIRADGTNAQFHAINQHGYVRMQPSSDSSVKFITELSKFHFGRPLLVGGAERYISATGTGALSLRTNNGSIENMRLHSNGNVSLGTAPNYEEFNLSGALVLGNSTFENNGTIRYVNGDFEGKTPNGWKKFTSGDIVYPTIIWVPAISHPGSGGYYANPCSESCLQSGLYAAADVNGFVCKKSDGTSKGRIVTAQQNGYMCEGSMLSQCSCISSSGASSLISDNSSVPNSQNSLQLERDSSLVYLSEYKGRRVISRQHIILSSSENLELYQNTPNPSNDLTEIKMTIPDYYDGIIELLIHDSTGNLLRQFTVLGRGLVVFEVDIAGLRPGSYIYSVTNNGSVIDSKTLIKQ